MCLVGGETTHPDDSMRCSGDRGYVDGDGLLAYLGRGDSQVKRWGHRINLEVVQLVGERDGGWREGGGTVHEMKYYTVHLLSKLSP